MKIQIVGMVLLTLMSCNYKKMEQTNVIFLHHSTGGRIWKGNPNKYFYKIFKQGQVEKWIKKHNKKSKTHINISQMTFPKKEPYGWKNYPFDYYNIWVKNAGAEHFMEEPTLEILTKEYDIIIFKHCFPVSNILPDSLEGGIDSEIKTINNYKLQYIALKEKMHAFPDTKFLLWTIAPRVASKTNEEEAKRAKEFYEWVKDQWDEKYDNIFLWDYYSLATEGELYLKPEYAEGKDNSHPHRKFAGKISEYFVNRIIQVMTGTADTSDITGKI